MLKRVALVAACGLLLAACGDLAVGTSSPTRTATATVAKSDCPPAPAPCGEPAEIAGAFHAAAVGEYLTGIAVAQYLEAVAAAERARVAAARARAPRASCYRAPPVYSEGDPYAGSIPSEIIRRESGGDYSAINCSSGASGKYQFLDSTWAGYGGYASARDAPPEVQDERAAQLYAASGCRPWGCP